MAHASTRRQFLTTAGAALSAPLFNSHIEGANSKINVAFIGVGGRGARNIGYAARVPGLRITAVCDVYPPAIDRALAQARRLGFHGVAARQDFREILADPAIDAVYIGTPDHWRAYITVEACKAGKDVYVESPVLISIDEGPKMVQAARRYKRVVQAGTVQRSAAFLQKAREIVRSGDLGDIRFCCAREAGSGARKGPPVDLVDMVQFAFDEAMPASITAQGGRFYAGDRLERPDTMLVTYRYRDFIASYESRGAAADARHTGAGRVFFHGTAATLMVNREGHAIFSNGSGERTEWRGISTEERRGVARSSMNLAHWQNFLNCIRTRQRPASEIETCVRSNATCVLANLAMRHNATLDWDDKAFTVKPPVSW